MSNRTATYLLSAAAAAAATALAHRWGLDARHTRRRVPAVPPPPPLTKDRPDRPPSQRLADGYGPIFHRVYRLDFAAEGATPAALMADLKRHINDYCPRELAAFERSMQQRAGRLTLGDEYVVRIRGPWNGPVRVIESTDEALGLVTLEDHMEAGQIRFSLSPAPAEVLESRPGALRYKVESWARSRDEAVDLAYHKLGVAMLAQQAVWVYMCRQVARKAGGRALGPVTVLTEQAPYDDNAHADYCPDA